MQRFLAVLLIGLMLASASRAQGLLVPADHDMQPLAMVRHQVSVAIEDQAAVTRVEQTFRNDSSRQLEATYLFPVPKGASVRRFSMWVDGKEVNGELVEAGKARQIYTDIVRRTQDPGLLEYMDANLIRLRVFPVPAHGDQKLSLSFTSVAHSDGGLIEYTYPLRADSKSAATLESFSLDVKLKSQHAIQSVYSPSHPVTVTRAGDRQAHVHYEQAHATLDKDFQLYFSSGGKDVGLTALLHRPETRSDGHFLLLISPRAELSTAKPLPRDMVFVLDTSGSMQGKRILQAKAALKFCLNNLGPQDRFGLIHFATTVDRHTPGLVKAGAAQIRRAQQWVDGLEAVGSTDINSALTAALEMRPSDSGRTFTIVFFTDGQPTVGEINPDRILENVAARNTANTRIFTFGVGDDVNAVLLDRLADRTRSVSTYVRESEDIEAKVSGLYTKISHPVLTGLKLNFGSDVKISEVYPPQLPDLFHGSQLVVLGRYKGHGHTRVTLTGSAGHENKEFVYEVNFPSRTKEDRAFVEDLWARRKVGYLLDQLRGSGENKEVMEEVVRLAKRYGIATPYTSYLVVPDQATPVANASSATGTSTASQGATFGMWNASSLVTPLPNGPGASTWRDQPINGFTSLPNSGPPPAAPPLPTTGVAGIQFAPVIVSPAMQWAVPSGATAPPVATRGFVDLDGSITGTQPGTFARKRQAAEEEEEEEEEPADGARPRSSAAAAQPALPVLSELQTGKLGVDLSEQLSDLRNQSQVTRAAARQAFGRRCVQVGGVWIDDGFQAKMKTVIVKAQSAAYFRILERHPAMKEVFRLGNRLVWVTPSQTALVIDTAGGLEQLGDDEIDRLFVARR
jgi:Ca-activated chloride channel family protein